MIAEAHDQPQGPMLGDPRIYAGLWLMQASVAVAQATVVSRSPLFASLFWGFACAVSLFLGLTHRAKPNALHPQLANGAAAIGGVSFLLSLLGGLANALLMLLLWLLVAKNITLARKRDGYFTMAISLVVLVFAAAESRSGWFLLVVAVFTLAGLFSLVLIHADDLSRDALGDKGPQGLSTPLPTSALPLTLGVLLVAAFLYLLMPTPTPLHWGAYMDPASQDYRDKQWEQDARTGESSRDKSEEPGEGTGLSGGDSSGSSGSQGQGPSYRGFSDRLDINGVSRQGIGNGIVLYVQAREPLYLTGKVFDTFDGARWTSTRTGERKIALRDGRHRFDPAESDEELEQDIEVAADLPSILFGASRVVEVGFPGSVIAADSLGSISIPRPLAKGTRYEVQSRIERVEGRPFVEASLDHPGRYLELPEDLDPAIADLAAQVAESAATPLARAVALEQHLRTSYEYSFESIFTSQGVTPLSEFLFETRRGHCEYFASALAIMLRTQGIPSRLVTGFSATTYNPLTGYLEVRALDGHAWVEAYVRDRGWLSLEPTPAYALPQPSQTQTTSQRLERYADELARQEELLGEEGVERDWLRGIAETFTLINQSVGHLWRLLTSGLWAWITDNRFLLMAIVLLLALGAFGWRQLRRPLKDWTARTRIQVACKGDPNRLVLLCVQEMEAWLARRGRGRASYQTLEEYAEELSQSAPRYHAPLTTLVELFSRVRYAEARLSSQEGASAFEAFSTIVSPENRSRSPEG